MRRTVLPAPGTTARQHGESRPARPCAISRRLSIVFSRFPGTGVLDGAPCKPRRSCRRRRSRKRADWFLPGSGVRDSAAPASAKFERGASHRPFDREEAGVGHQLDGRETGGLAAAEDPDDDAGGKVVSIRSGLLALFATSFAPTPLSRTVTPSLIISRIDGLHEACRILSRRRRRAILIRPSFTSSVACVVNHKGTFIQVPSGRKLHGLKAARNIRLS